MTILQAPSKVLFKDLACLSCCTPLLDPFAQKYCLHCGGSVLVHQCACGRPVPHKPDGTLYNHCSSCGLSTKDVAEKRPKIRLMYPEDQDYKLTCPCISREPLQEKQSNQNSQLLRSGSGKKRKIAHRPPDQDDAEIAERLFGPGSMDYDESFNSDDTELAYTGDVLQLMPDKVSKLVSGVKMQSTSSSFNTRKVSDARDKLIPEGRQRQPGQIGGGKAHPNRVFDESACRYLIHRSIQLMEEKRSPCWKTVADELRAKGHQVSETQCIKKFSYLKKCYEAIKCETSTLPPDLQHIMASKADKFSFKDDFRDAYALYLPSSSQNKATTDNWPAKSDANTANDATTASETNTLITDRHQPSDYYPTHHWPISTQASRVVFPTYTPQNVIKEERSVQDSSDDPT